MRDLLGSRVVLVVGVVVVESSERKGESWFSCAPQSRAANFVALECAERADRRNGRAEIHF